jgi:hypothetical protein
MTLNGGRSGIGVVASARLSQVRYAYDDDTRRDDLFPQGRLDADLQQVDLREQQLLAPGSRRGLDGRDARGSARQRRGTLHVVRRLKPLMLRTQDRDKHIVNVSAVEGQFYRNQDRLGTRTPTWPRPRST